MQNSWDVESLRARVSDPKHRIRYEAGSPNSSEIEAYENALPSRLLRDTAIVLGMTPELRLLATRLFHKVISIDKNPQAIELYSDWLPRENRKRETIVCDEWSNLFQHALKSVSVILGDGAFGNILGIQEHKEMLRCIKSALLPQGVFITRHAFIPKGFIPGENNTDCFVKRFRSRRIDEAEFGFGVRLLGHYSCCYNPESFILDNRKIFQECEFMHQEGQLIDEEYSYIRRYYFNGVNCILPEDVWESLLDESGFNFEIQPCHGKEWYEYYKVYKCFVNKDEI